MVLLTACYEVSLIGSLELQEPRGKKKKKKGCVNFKRLLSKAEVSMDRYCLVSRTCCQSQKAIVNLNDVALNNQKMKTHF